MPHAPEKNVSYTLNGKPAEVKPNTTISDLLLKWKIRPELVAVEYNESILQKAEYDTTMIQDKDHVEFVFYMGGGAKR